MCEKVYSPLGFFEADTVLWFLIRSVYGCDKPRCRILFESGGGDWKWYFQQSDSLTWCQSKVAI